MWRFSGTLRAPPHRKPASFFPSPSPSSLPGTLLPGPSWSLLNGKYIRTDAVVKGKIYREVRSDAAPRIREGEEGETGAASPKHAEGLAPSPVTGFPPPSSRRGR